MSERAWSIVFHLGLVAILGSPPAMLLMAHFGGNSQLVVDASDALLSTMYAGMLIASICSIRALAIEIRDRMQKRRWHQLN